ncbi:MAG: hypothetical protein ACM3O4_02465 [Ignavibacteriales bacterium]
MKYIGFFKDVLNNEIQINKIGLTIRRLNEDEKKELSNYFNNYFFSQKAKHAINRYYNEFVKNNEKGGNNDIRKKYVLSKHFNSLDKNQIDAITFFTQVILEKNGKFNKNTFNRINNKLVIFEIDCEILNDFIDPSFFKSSIEYIILLSHIISGISLCKIVFLKKYEDFLEGKHQMLFWYNTLNDDFDSYPALYLPEFCAKTMVEGPSFIAKGKNICQISEIGTLLQKSDRISIRNFFIILDMIFQENLSVENKIVNRTSIIERILMNKDDDKNDKFILKMGIVIQEIIPQEYLRLKLLKDQLDFCYKIRSCIVHGNEDKLMSFFSKLNTTTDGSYNEQMENCKTTIEKRKFLLKQTSELLWMYVVVLVVYWTKNYDKIRFLKEN